MNTSNRLFGSPTTTARSVFVRPAVTGLPEAVTTVDEPKTYTRPWTVSMHQGIKLDTELIDEFSLENGKSPSRMKAADRR